MQNILAIIVQIILRVDIIHLLFKSERLVWVSIRAHVRIYYGSESSAILERFVGLLDEALAALTSSSSLSAVPVLLRLALARLLR